MDKSRNNIRLVPSVQCTGCGTCKEVCNKDAISFISDLEGFPIPEIDENKCINCGLCVKKCPVIYPPIKTPIQLCYAAQIRDKKALQNSSSGGVFTAISREIFKAHGVVFGCVWDHNYNAIFTKAETEEELEPMRGSKYVMSKAHHCFPEIKQYLEKGRTVLFAGLSCQIAGLKNYLGTEYKNLYLLDFLCGGAASPMVWNKYLDSICKFEERSSLNFKFRDKEPDGVGIHITYAGKKKKTRSDSCENPYFYAYASHLIIRHSCILCPYENTLRVSDLTMGDFWGVWKFYTEFNDREGVSLLLCNTAKGEEILRNIKDSIYLLPTTKEKIAQHNNLTCNNVIHKKYVPPYRSEFFHQLKVNGWKAADLCQNTHERKKEYFKTYIPKWVSKIIRIYLIKQAQKEIQ